MGHFDEGFAVLHAVRQPSTGGLWVCVTDKPPYAYEFEPVQGLGVPAPDEGESS